MIVKNESAKPGRLSPTIDSPDSLSKDLGQGNGDRAGIQVEEEIRELHQRVTDPEDYKSRFRLAEEALDDRENRYRFMVDNTKEIILILSKLGKILFANKTTYALFGYAPEELNGRPITSFITRDSIKTALLALAQEFLGRPQPEIEIRAKTKSGEIRHLVVSEGSVPIHEKGKLTGVMVCARDVTENRRAEEKLRESERRFKELWENAPVAYHTLDAQGIITGVNQTETKMLGYTKEEMEGRSFLEFVLPEQRIEAEKRFRRKISGQDSPKAENRFYVKKDGSKISVLVDDALERDREGRVTGIRTTMADITMDKEAEVALKRSEERYRDLVEKAGFAILIEDMEGNFKYANEKLAEIFGYFPEEMKKTSISSIVHPDDFERVMAHHRERFQGRQAPSRYEFKGIRKDGSVLYIEVDTTPLIEGEQIMGSRSYLRDVTERQRMQEKLLESEQTFRSIVENSHDGICIVDDAFRFIYINDEISRLTGYSREEVLGRDFRKFLDDESRAILEKHYILRQKGEKVPRRYELSLKQKDGAKRPVEISASVFKDSAGMTRTVAQFLDITERKLAEEALRESEQKFKNLAEQSPSMIFINKNGQIVYANKKFEEVLGYQREEIYSPDFDFFKLIAPEHRYKKIENFEMHTKGFDVPPFESAFLTKAGDRTEVILTTKLIEYGEEKAILGIATDISERKKAEDALLESEERYASLFDRSLDCVYIHDFEGKFIDANTSALAILGFNKEEIRSQNFTSVLSEDQLPLASQTLKELIETGHQKGTTEYRVKHRNGGFVDIETKASIIFRDGKPYAIQGIGRDITERKLAEKQLEESFVKLRKALNGIIQAIAMTVERRDPYTAGHQRRVADLARAIATEMSLSKDQIEAIRTAGVIHDIGKISVPAEILSKPGRLSDNEFSLIKEHSKIGYDILKEIEFPWPIAQIVLQHHERMDGSGYPVGLTGQDILLEARVLGVADVVEAMASHRPYRPSHGIEKALEEISQNKAILYDPDVVNACLKIFAEKKYTFKQT